MNLFDDCPTDNFQATGAVAAAGVMTVNWIPAVGELWEVLYADVFHNDAAAPAGAWVFRDGVMPIQFGNAAALAAATRVSLYNAGFPPRLYLDHRCMLTYTVAVGATNGCILTLNVIGRRLRGTQ